MNSMQCYCTRTGRREVCKG